MKRNVSRQGHFRHTTTDRSVETRLTTDRLLPSTRVVVEAFTVGLLMSIVYISTLAGNHSEAEDGIRYLNDVATGEPSTISHPYHLSYGWFVWVAYQLAVNLGYDGESLLLAQVMNAFTGALGIALLWVLLRAVTLERLATTVGCGLLAFSYGYWWYSVEVEVYILSAALLIAGLLLAYIAATRPTVLAFALLGGFAGLAVLAHLTNVLFGAVVTTALLLAARRVRVRNAVGYGLAAAGAGLVTVILPYTLAIFAAGLRTPREVFDWLTIYIQADLGGEWAASTLPQTIVGVGRALVGGHFAFSFDSVRKFASARFSGNQLVEEVFLVRSFHPMLATVLLILTVVLAAMLLVTVIWWLLQRKLDGRARVLALLCLSWLLPYTLFFAWWQPYNVEFWIAPWVPIAVFFALLSSRTGESKRKRLRVSMTALLLLDLFAINFVGSVWPQQDPNKDYWRVRSSWYEQHTNPSDLVVSTGYIWSNYLNYFGAADTFRVEEAFTEATSAKKVLLRIEERIEESGKERVLFSSEVFYPASDAFSRCPNPNLCRHAAHIRGEFLPLTRTVNDGPHEVVRELTEHPSASDDKRGTRD